MRAAPDGTARIALTAPTIPHDANAVLLVFHSDREAHETSRGDIGVNAHHRLIAKTH
ncbi:MAG: hypothetical protein ABIU58_10445 [Ramlibacter sp.]